MSAQPKPSTARVAAMRAKRKAGGLARLEVFARPEHHKPIKDFAKSLNTTFFDGSETTAPCILTPARRMLICDSGSMNLVDCVDAQESDEL